MNTLYILEAPEHRRGLRPRRSSPQRPRGVQVSERAVRARPRGDQPQGNVIARLRSRNGQCRASAPACESDGPPTSPPRCRSRTSTPWSGRSVRPEGVHHWHSRWMWSDPGSKGIPGADRRRTGKLCGRPHYRPGQAGNLGGPGPPSSRPTSACAEGQSFRPTASRRGPARPRRLPPCCGCAAPAAVAGAEPRSAGRSVSTEKAPDSMSISSRALRSMLTPSQTNHLRASRPASSVGGDDQVESSADRFRRRSTQLVRAWALATGSDTLTTGYPVVLL